MGAHFFLSTCRQVVRHWDSQTEHLLFHTMYLTHTNRESEICKWCNAHKTEKTIHAKVWLTSGHTDPKLFMDTNSPLSLSYLMLCAHNEQEERTAQTTRIQNGKYIFPWSLQIHQLPWTWATVMCMVLSNSKHKVWNDIGQDHVKNMQLRVVPFLQNNWSGSPQKKSFISLEHSLILLVMANRSNHFSSKHS